MLGGEDLAGRALEKRGQPFTGKPTDLSALMLSLHLDLRPVGEIPGRRVEER